MKIRTTLAVLALSLTPAMAFAGPGCGNKIKAESASSCVPGSTWDETKATCVANPTS